MELRNCIGGDGCVVIERTTSQQCECPFIIIMLMEVLSSLQLVWATTSRVGCAVHVCPRMNVWGEIWENAVYLVCNYSPK